MTKWTEGPRASVRISLVNPESGYESETVGTVSAAGWSVIDAVMCGRESVYAAAPDLHAAAVRVLAGLNARIDAADRTSVPVFDGIAELHDAINKANPAALSLARGE